METSAPHPQSILEKILAHLPQLTKFVVTGGTATLVHMGLFWVFKQWMPIVVATTLGFLIAFVVSFTLQKYWTFKSQGQVAKQGIAFFVLQMVNLTINALAMYVLVEKFGFWDMGSQFVVLGTLAVSTFIISKLFIFKQT